MKRDTFSSNGREETRNDLLRSLEDAYETGRPIVPLVGAGISVESGYPLTSQIVRYLAKAHHFLDSKFYLSDDKARKDPDHVLHYSREEHLSIYGWPDPFELNEVLWNEDGDLSTRISMRELTEHIYKKHLRDESRGHLDRQEALVWLLTLPDAAGALPERIRYVASSPVANPHWRAFLRWVTGSRDDHVDNLFQMLNRGRLPGNSHRFLVFLSRLLGWRLILTTNFDDLIERAMRSEGLFPTVFDVWRDAELPHELLVGGRLSIVKLHGSAYGLRVGESLDAPLKPHETEKVLRYMPDNPLLLVLGYGGQDRRIMDLVRAVLERAKRNRRRGPHVAWAHFESEYPDPLRKLLDDIKQHPAPLKAKDLDAYIVAGRTFDAGSFLIGLYSRYTSAHPSTAGSYRLGQGRPLGLTMKRFIGAATSASNCADHSCVHIFCGAPQSDGDDEDPATTRPECCPVDVSSIAMSEYVSERSSTHTPIWFHASMFQSLEELIAAVIAECRKHDSTLPSYVLPVGGDDVQSEYGSEELKKGIRLVRTALRRGAYILAIDEIASFGRPPTTHHGLPVSCAACPREGPGAVPVPPGPCKGSLQRTL